MDTALITGMLETKVLPEIKVEKDVKNLDGSSFGDIFNKSLSSEDVKNKDVDSDSLEVDKKEVNEKDKNKKKIKKDEIENSNVDVSNIKDVQNREENKIDGNDVELESISKIKDESENVIEVGPQLVETEKIKLNIKDVEIEEKLNQDQEKAIFDLERLEKMLKEKISKEDVKENGEVFNEKVLKNIDVLKKGLNNSQDVEEGSLTQIVVDNKDVKDKFTKGELDKKDFEGKDGGKENKFKTKDVEKKGSNSFLERIMEDTDVKIEDKFNIKEVTNIEKFQKMDVEQLDILDQVTEKLEVSLFDNKSEMVIKLKPNDLGNVTVKISIENGVMNAKFLADSIKVKETLESSLNNLKESLKEQGLNVQDLSVSVDSGRSQNQNFEQNNLVYFNNRKDYRKNDSLDYEDNYYEIADVNRKVSNSQWRDSTVSFLA